MAGRRLHEGGHALCAHRLGEGAAGVEAATRRRVDRVGRVARERGLGGALQRVGAGHRLQQRAGVGVARRVEDLLGRPHLDHLAQVHHQHPVAHVAHHVQVVADEEVGQAEVALQVLQQVEHLRLDRLVERRHGFVQNHQPRLQRQRPGDVDPLALPARQLVRIAAGEARRVQPHPGQQVVRPGERRALRHAVHRGAEGDRILDRHPRVERRIAVLEHHLRLAPELAQRQPAGADRLAVEHQLAPVLAGELHQQPGGGRFAAARFADHAQRLALLDVEAHVVDRAHRGPRAPHRQALSLQRKVLLQVLHPQQRLARAAQVARVGQGGGGDVEQGAHKKTSGPRTAAPAPCGSAGRGLIA